MSKEKKNRNRWKFTARERRGVLLLIPLLAALGWILWATGRSHFDGSAEVVGNALAESGGGNRAQSGTAAAKPGHSLFEFDPNTVTYEELREMGVEKNIAASLVRSRERGKVFQIPEDFATSYGISDSMYAVFKPFIRIGGEYRPKPYCTEPESGRNTETAGEPEPTLAPFDPNSYTSSDFTALGFSPAQSEAIIRYRDSRGGFPSAEDFARCYVVSEAMYAKLKDFIVISVAEGVSDMGGGPKAHEKPLPVDINTADSVALVSVRGIGPRTAQEIIAHRERLGGFHSVAQLAELKAVTEKNYELMSGEIWADSCAIQKIDINFATPKEIGAHPYITGPKLRRILRNRQLKGGWRTIEEMIEDDTLTAEEAERLSPYLHFGLR